MTEARRTLFFDRHRDLGARVTEFGGWDMPLQYPAGTISEHLAVRRHAGVFDVSHMGRFTVRGPQARAFLQHVLTNNAEALDLRPHGAQYTLIANDRGGAVDDAYLYRFTSDEHLLVVNASNREKDWAHLQAFAGGFDVEMSDDTFDVAMLAVQGPDARAILAGLLTGGRLPEPMRNSVGTAELAGASVRIGRTGYTGEPVAFELFIPADDGLKVWDALVDAGAAPAGLGARDTLRLEAGLPLYGDELGPDHDGSDIPILAVPIARFGVSFAAHKGDFVGRERLERQAAAAARIRERDTTDVRDLPRMIRPVAITGRGIARAGSAVLRDGAPVGWITSGTAVPYWVFDGEGETARPTGEHRTRAIALAYLDSHLLDGDVVAVDIRGKQTDAEIVKHHLRSDAPPYARPIVVTRDDRSGHTPTTSTREKVRSLLERAEGNHRWRQHECIDLIPSEMTQSPVVRMLQVMDPSFRYAEHRALEAFYDAEVFYYQGTEFIADVERLVNQEMAAFLGAREVESNGRHTSA